MRIRPRAIKVEDDLWNGHEGTTRMEILSIVRKKPIKMTDLRKALVDLIKSRGALKYHLTLLERFDFIKPLKRTETEYGRPTYVIINKSKFNKSKLDKKQKEFEKKANEYKVKIDRDPLKIKILNILKTNKEKSLFDIYVYLKKENNDLMVSKVISMLQYLEHNNKVKNVWKLNKN